MKKNNFSLVIITLNEEKNIARCIQSVPFADEVLVLDSGSTDKTVEIAESLGAKVIQQEWLGFGKQKQKAVDLAVNDWVLSLDADEELNSDAQEELKDLLSTSLDKDFAYSFPRLTFLVDQPLRHGGNYPDRQTRFFHKGSARWSTDAVHEKLIANKVVKLKSDILHWSFPTLAAQMKTIEKYSTLRAQMWFQQGRKASALRIFLKPKYKFFEIFVLKLGFLDGAAGLQAAKAGAHSYYLRLTKLKKLLDLKETDQQERA